MKVAVSRAASGQGLVVDVDVVLGQPGGQRDVGTEGDHVVEAEPPYAHLLQGLQELDDRAAAPGLWSWRGEANHVMAAMISSSAAYMKGTKRQPPGMTATHVSGGGDGHDERRADELGDRGADVARAEDPECEALVLRWPPCRDPGDADAEGVAGEPDEECVEQQHLVAGDRGDQVGRDGGRGQHEGEDLPTTLPVGDDAGGQPPDRAVEDRDRGDPGQLHVSEPELLADGDSQHPEHQPDGEHQGEGDR